MGAAALTLAGCRRADDHTSAQAALSASVAAAASSFVAQARAAHLEQELHRAQKRWEEKPALGDCAAALHEKADLELCQAASSALLAIEKNPDAPAQSNLPLLAEGALALARLSQRVRYLSLAELADRRVSTDAGTPPTASASPRLVTPARRVHPSAADSEHTVQLREGPVSQLMSETIRLEREVMRNLGAYLEYAELPVRRAAFETVKRLRNEHPQWPLIEAQLREAALLESDPALKRELREFAASGLPASNHPGQSPDSK